MANLSKQHVHNNHEKICELFNELLIASQSRVPFYYLSICIVAFLILFLCGWEIWDNGRAIKCIMPNTYLIWEATRPQTNCQICNNVFSVIDLNNVTRDEFSKWAYTSTPVVIRGAALNWPATNLFSFYFLKNMLTSFEGAFEALADDCQLLTFKSDLMDLREIFEMHESRVNGVPGAKPWYVGWSFCQPELVKKMRQYYPRPHFLPEDAEHSHVDYVFMGYNQGAIMHLDYISRLLWQAQLVGSKSWRLVPPPECQHICSELSVTVNRGDIILIDTRQWYHDTKVPPGQFSLTISSEYG